MVALGEAGGRRPIAGGIIMVALEIFTAFRLLLFVCPLSQLLLLYLPYRTLNMKMTTCIQI